MKKNNVPPALKHGAYSGLGVLPGEDPAEFQKLHDKLIAEFGPVGAFEHDMIEELTGYVWRKKNLITYQIAKSAKRKRKSIERSYGLEESIELLTLEAMVAGSDRRTSEEKEQDEQDRSASRRAAEEEAKKQLGWTWDLTNLDIGNTEELTKELDVLERLEGAISRWLKRWLLVKGAKSLSVSPPITLIPPPKRSPPPIHKQPQIEYKMKTRKRSIFSN